MPSKTAIIFGGNGQVGRLIAVRLLDCSYNVISVIRTGSQSRDITALGRDRPGRIDTVVQDLAILTAVTDVTKLLDSVYPTVVIWAAASMSQPDLIDSQVARTVFDAASTHPSVKKLLSISAYSARRSPAPWWSTADCRYWEQETRSYPQIWLAKVQADEHLARLNRTSRSDFQAISLRPVWFGGTQKGIDIGKVAVQGTVPPRSVADAAVELLEREDSRGWYDVAGGSHGVAEAVEQAVTQGIDCVAGEDPW